MARKRELTVEVWNEAMLRQENHARIVGTRAFLAEHEKRLRALEAKGEFDFIYELGDVLYELQIAQAWREAGMQVYDFDPDFATSILDEKWVELLPDCIKYRPCDSFYMKLPCGPQSEGVVVSVTPAEKIIGFDRRLFPGCDEKGVVFGGDPKSADGPNGRCVVNTGDELLCLCSFAISKTFELMVDDTPVDKYPADLTANGVAYLCSTNADIVPSYEPQRGIRRNNAKRRSQATWNDVGYRIGAELRAWKRKGPASHSGNGAGGSVRPHMRRAHWHHFWVGPRDGERKLVLKWLAPTMVNGGDYERATLHKVG